MKKIYKFALMLIAILTCAVFSACKDKYADLKMSFISTDGTTLENVRLVYDETGESTSQRIAVKVTGIKQQEIGELAIYSSPMERVVISDHKYEDDLCYITVTANVVGSGELVVTHLASNVSYSIPLHVVQKSSDANAVDDTYIISIPEVGTKEHKLNVKQLVELYPKNSGDDIYFKLPQFDTLPLDVEPITKKIGEEEYIIGFIIDSETSERVIRLNPVTVMEGYDDKIHTDEIIYVEFFKILKPENVEFEVHPTYDLSKVTYLVANDKSMNYGIGNYNELKVTLNYKNSEGLTFQIDNFLNYYDIVLPEDSNLINKELVGMDQVVITANADTQQPINASVLLQPKDEFIGEIYSVEKFVRVQGVTKADSIEVRKNRTAITNKDLDATSDYYFNKNLMTYFTDIYDYYEIGNANGALFNFEAKTNSGVSVFSDFSKLQIAISPDVMFNNANIYEDATFETKTNIYDTLVGSKRYNINIHKSSSPLKFYYDSYLQLMVSEVFSSTDNLYIKYETNTSPTASEATDFCFYLKTYNNSLMAGNPYLSDIDPTVVKVEFERNDSIKTMQIEAGRYYEIYAVETRVPFTNAGAVIEADKVYLNRSEGLDNALFESTGYDITKPNLNPKLLFFNNTDAIKGYNKTLQYAKFKVEVVPQFENCEYPLKVKSDVFKTNDELGAKDENTAIVYEYNTTKAYNVIGLGFNSTTSVGKYNIVFTQLDDAGTIMYRKTIEVEVYQQVEESQINVEISETQHLIKNAIDDGHGGISYVFGGYYSDYIVGSEEMFDAKIHLPEESLSIVNGYVFEGSTIYTFDPTVDPTLAWGATTEDPEGFISVSHEIKTNNFARITPKQGTFLDYENHYVSIKLGVETKSFENIVTPKAGGEIVVIELKFFIYQQIEASDISINATYLEKYMSGFLGVYNQADSVANLNITMDSNLWNYVQPQMQNTAVNHVGIDYAYGYKVVWSAEYVSNLGVVNANFTNYAETTTQTDRSIELLLKDPNPSSLSHIKPPYTIKLTAIIYQFNTPFSFGTEIYVSKPIVTQKMILNSATAGDGVINLKLGETYKVDVSKLSEEGEVSVDGIVIQVVDLYGTAVTDAVSINEETQEIIVTNVQPNLRLMVFAKDALKYILTSGMSGYNNPSYLLVKGHEKAYLEVDLDLIDGKTVETAFKIYNENDFWDIQDNLGSYYRLVNNITINNSNKLIDNFSGTIFTNEEQYTIYGVKLTQRDNSLFKNFTGAIYNVGFGVEYAVEVTSLESDINVGIVDVVTENAKLVNVSAILTGSVKIVNGTGFANVGSLAGTNEGSIIYTEGTTQDVAINGVAGTYDNVINVDPTNVLLAPGYKVIGVSGTIELLGNGKVYFGGITGYNKKEIEGYQNIETDLSASVGDIIFDITLDSEGKLANIYIDAVDLTNTSSAVGGAVGLQEGTINSGWVDGAITGLYNLGGVIGEHTSATKNNVFVDTRLSAGNLDEGIREIRILSSAYTAQDVKSSVNMKGVSNVGGIVGKDTNGIYNHVYYQVIASTTRKTTSIVGETNVGGIAGYSLDGIFKNCSVMSYCWEYDDLSTSFANDAISDISGNDYVGGIVGRAESGSIISSKSHTSSDLENTYDSLLVITNSSVNAYISQNSSQIGLGAVGGILSTPLEISTGVYAGTTNGSTVIFNAYFIGKIDGNVVYSDIIVNNGQLQQLCLTNKKISSINKVYSINETVTGRIDYTTTDGLFAWNPDTIPNGEYWGKYDGLNNDKVFVTVDASNGSSSGGKKPIFEVAPTEFEVTAINNVITNKSFYLEYYNFGSLTLDPSIINTLNEKYNKVKTDSKRGLEKYLSFTYAPNASDIIVNVKSSNSRVVEVTRKGEILINGTGTAILTFSPILNPVIEERITVNVIDPIGNMVLAKSADEYISINTFNITKDGSKLLFLNSKLQVEEDITGDTIKETVDINANDKVNLKVAISVHSGDLGADAVTGTALTIADYLSISGKEFSVETINFQECYVVNITHDELFSIKVNRYKENLKFNIQAMPYMNLINENGTYSSIDLTDTIDDIVLSLSEGATHVTLSQDFAYIYPNDQTIITAYIKTDIELSDDEIINSIIVNGYQNVGTCVLLENNGYNSDTKIQTVRYKFEVDKTKLDVFNPNKDEPLDIELWFTVNSNGSKVDYTILPQRINYLEIKNYIYKNNEFITSDVLRPATTESSNGGIITIDIAPINGYFDYLEIKDITGDEEIKFIQVVQEGTNWKPVAGEDVPTGDGKGIKLSKVAGYDRIYVLTQISKEYTTKPHTVQVTAHLEKQSAPISRNTKIIQVKMLPTVKVDYMLPDDSIATHIDSSTSNDSLSAYLANGTSVKLRISTSNANRGIESKVSIEGNDSYYILEHAGYGDFYVLNLNQSINTSYLGKKLVVEITTRMVAEDGQTEISAPAKLEFTLVNFVIHNVSLTNASGNTISGNIDTPTSLEFYFSETDISYYENGSFNRVKYTYDPDIASGEDKDDDSIYEINEILKELNTEDWLNVDPSTAIDKIDLTNAGADKYTLTVQNEYNKDAKLKLKLHIKLEDNDWILDESATSTNVIAKEYALNFTMISSRTKPKVIKNEEDFKAMTSGKNNFYILGNDLELTDYVPINVDVAEFDGNGRKITIKSFGVFNDADMQIGLFKQVSENMIVKNIVVEYNITGSDWCNNPDVNYTSATFGGITPLNKGIITNCVVQGEISQIKVSTLAQKKIQQSAEEYSIAFNIGGVIGINETTAYVTHSTTTLKIVSQANIGGFVYENKGKIVSSSVKEATIDAYPQNYDKTIVTQVSGFVVTNRSGATNAYSGKSTGEISMCGVEYLQQTLSAKDTSTGFVWTNNSKISDCYVEITSLGNKSNTFLGFVNKNSGPITRCYTYINKGVGGNNINMFAPGGTANIIDCIEVVAFKVGYSNYIESGLKTVSLENKNNKEVYENLDFAFGDNLSAVWTLESGLLPRLISVKENLEIKQYSDSLGDETFYGLRNVYKVEIEDGSYNFEYQVNDGTYGTKENPYIITNLKYYDEDLKEDISKRDWNTYFTNGTKKYYRIVTDIDFSAYSSNPITSTMTFSGNIQGNNMTLSGIMLYAETELESIGLFKSLEGVKDISVENTIRNLNIKTTSVWATKTKAVGLLAGISTDFSLYNITTDTSSQIIVGGNAVGGIVGLLRGNFDAQQLSSNIGANSTRATAQQKYSIYMSYNNNRDAGVSYNLKNVYYAGSVFGIVDGYDKSVYKINDPRDIAVDVYHKIRDINVNGNITVVGDTVGAAIGFVGERVFVEDVKVTLTGGSISGAKYSSGIIGENRGVVNNATLNIQSDELFTRSTLVSAGVVGLNLGGLVQNATVTGNILNSGTGTTTGGIVGRNINGNVNNCVFDGTLNGYYIGGIIGSDYSYRSLVSWISTGALADECRNEIVIPKNEIVYKNKGRTIANYQNNKITKLTLDNYFANIRKYYTFRSASSYEQSISAYYVYGLFVGITDNQNTFVTNVGYDTVSGCLVFNGEYYSDAIANFIASASDGYLVTPNPTDQYKIETPFSNVITNTDLLPKDMKNYIIFTYLVGAKVSSFEAWSREYSYETLVFANADKINNEIRKTSQNAKILISYNLTIDEVTKQKNHNYNITLLDLVDGDKFILNIGAYAFEDLEGETSDDLSIKINNLELDDFEESELEMNIVSGKLKYDTSVVTTVLISGCRKNIQNISERQNYIFTFSF